jgi:thiol-disulfide isomerase/thioredoxin
MRRILSLVLVFALVAFSGLTQVSFAKETNDGWIEQNNVPLLEMFTAEWCGPCASASPDLDSLYNQQEPSFNMLKYHVFDDLQVPFSKKRGIQYQIKAVPTINVSGKKVLLGWGNGCKGILKEYLENWSAPENVSIAGKIEKTEDSIIIDTKFECDSYEEETIVYAAIVQDYFKYNCSNGEKMVRNIVIDGQDMEVFKNSECSFEFQIKDEWFMPMTRCLVWIQNENGILASVWLDFGNPIPDAKKAVLMVDPIVDFGEISLGKDYSRRVEISNFGEGTARFKLESNNPAIEFESEIVIKPYQTEKIRVTILHEELKPGDFVFPVKIVAEEDVVSEGLPLEFSIELRVLGKPELVVEPEEFKPESITRDELEKGFTLVLKNAVDGPLKGKVKSNDSRVNVSKKIIKNQSNELLITFDLDDLSIGEFSSTITITTQGGDYEFPVQFNLLD